MSNILDDQRTSSTNILPKKEKRILWMNIIVFGVISVKSLFSVSNVNLQSVFGVIAIIGFFVMFLGIRITTTYWRKHLRELNLSEKVLLLFPIFNFILLAFSSVTNIAH